MNYWMITVNVSIWLGSGDLPQAQFDSSNMVMIMNYWMNKYSKCQHLTWQCGLATAVLPQEQFANNINNYLEEMVQFHGFSFFAQPYGKNGVLGWTMCLCSCSMYFCLSMCQLIYFEQLHSHSGSCLFHLFMNVLASPVINQTRIFDSWDKCELILCCWIGTACVSGT